MGGGVAGIPCVRVVVVSSARGQNERDEWDEWVGELVSVCES